MKSRGEYLEPYEDGFSNLAEFVFGSDPTSVDIDANGNGVPDLVDARRMEILPSLVVPWLLGD